MNGRGKPPRTNHAAALSVMIAVCAICASTTAEAKKRPGTEAQQRACTPDVFRLCSAHIPFVRAIVSCLERNKRRLSPACRAVFEGRL